MYMYVYIYIYIYIPQTVLALEGFLLVLWNTGLAPVDGCRPRA